jgi:TonB family protein
MGQSLACHVLVVVSVYVLTLAWLNQPRVIVEEPLKNATLHYELTEYLPEVAPRHKMPHTPTRRQAQTADPEYSPQQIISINPDHISTKQTIVQANPNILRQDVRLPNLVVVTAFPGAPMAMNHPLQVLPVNMPQVAPPAQQTAERDFAARAVPISGPIVVAPAQDTAARPPDTLQIPVQSPPEVAGPPAEVAPQHGLAQALPLNAPEVVPPAQATAQRDFSRLGLPTQQADAAQPAPSITSGTGRARAQEVGQLLALNAHPIAPAGPVVVPEGNRSGEFAAGPGGHAGATARPEIRQGDSNSAAHAPGEGAGLANIYVSPPPTKTVAGTVAARSALPSTPIARAATVDRTDKQRPADNIDERIFGARKHYSMRLNMPNLNSSMGSWSIRFAELNSTPQSQIDISAPEALRKVDPAYPQDLVQGRVEGVVVLYAIIHSDGSVGEVRILEGFESRLDENARTALQQWRFRPGTKDGMPVDIEAVVRVPFRVPRNSF